MAKKREKHELYFCRFNITQFKFSSKINLCVLILNSYINLTLDLALVERCCWFNIHKITFLTSKGLCQKLCFCQERTARVKRQRRGKEQKISKTLDEKKAGRCASHTNILKKYSFLIQIFIFQFYPSLKWLCVCVKIKWKPFMRYIDILTNNSFDMCVHWDLISLPLWPCMHARNNSL